MYGQLLFRIAAMLAFTLTISKKGKLTSELIEEKAVIEARLVEAFDRLAEEGANTRNNDEKYAHLELRMKATEQRFQKLLAEEKNKLELKLQLESGMLDKQTAQLAALNAERAAMTQETEIHILQTLEEEESTIRHGDDDENAEKITALKTVHAEILQQVTNTFMDQLKAVEEVKMELKKERDALAKELTRTKTALEEKRKAEQHKQQKGGGPPGVDAAEKKTAGIICDLQASLATAWRETQDWRTEAYIAIVRRMPPSPRGVSLFGMDSRNFPLSNQMSVSLPNLLNNLRTGIPLGFSVDSPSDYVTNVAPNNVAPNLAPSLPLSALPPTPNNNHANPLSSFPYSQPAPAAGLDPDASEFSLVIKDTSET